MSEKIERFDLAKAITRGLKMAWRADRTVVMSRRYRQPAAT